MWDITEEVTETKEGEKETFRKDLKNEKVFSQCEYNNKSVKWLFNQDIGMKCTLYIALSVQSNLQTWLFDFIITWTLFSGPNNVDSPNPVLIKLIFNLFIDS